MGKYASLLAVSGGLALATWGCAQATEDSAHEAEETAACAVFEGCAGCEVGGCGGFGCEGCTACGACAGCSACEGADCGAINGNGTGSFTFACAADACEAGACAGACEGACEGASEGSDDRIALDLKPYPQWPPERWSSRVEIDDLIEYREGLSLYDASQLLQEALIASDYGEYSFYSVPGGFVLVTERERIDPEGYSVPEPMRYRGPDEGRDGLFTQLRDLFLERPESYYRYVVIVVSNRRFSPVDRELSASDARERVTEGVSDLPRDARDIPFSDDFKVNALIYEYENPGVGTDYAPTADRIVGGRTHLRRMGSGFEEAVRRAFAGGDRR